MASSPPPLPQPIPTTPSRMTQLHTPGPRALTPTSLRSLTGSPRDPNFAPPTRPPSALSATSDASFFALYDDAPVPPSEVPGARAGKALPQRTVFATIRRHGQVCLLCGGGRMDVGELVVVRVEEGVDEDEEGGARDRNPISRLKALKLLPPHYSRDDWTNLMTLCRPHADAYDAGAWRWLPNAAFRAQVARDPAPHPVSPHAQKHEHDEDEDEDMDEEGDVTMTDANEIDIDRSTSVQTQDGLGVPAVGIAAETLVDDGISGDTRNPEIHFQPVELPTFDVLILEPTRMPPMRSAPFPPPAVRVWRDWRKLTLNPYVVLGAAVAVSAAAAPLGSDPALEDVANECAMVREGWTRALGGV